MMAPKQTVWQLRRQVWWFYIRLRAVEFSPMLSRWLERFGRQMLPVLQPRRLDDAPASASSIGEQLATLQPGGLVVVPAFFVGATAPMFCGFHTLWPLTQYFYTTESAERQQRRLARRFPGCVVLNVALTFDPAVPEQFAGLEHVRHEVAAELLRAGQ